MSDEVAKVCKSCGRSMHRAAKGRRNGKRLFRWVCHHCVYVKERALAGLAPGDRKPRAQPSPTMRARNARASTAYRTVYPERISANWAVQTALRNGTLQRQPCVRCGAVGTVEAHHEDYSKPLDVVWLCAAHHHQRHAEMRRAGAIAPSPQASETVGAGGLQ